MSFDVASIKLHKGIITFSSDPAIKGRTVRSTASTLCNFIEYAYGIRGDQLVGEPKWAADEHYDLDAKSEGEATLTTAQTRAMMQSLLAERFQLKVHRETLEVPIYNLVVGKNGPKFQPSAPDATGGFRVRAGATGDHMEVKRGTMAQFARQLSFYAGRPVVDRTGLDGAYAFTLDWVPAPPPDSDAPDIFAALREQLGLLLESTKGPVEKLVIDHVEKPSEN